MEIDDVILRRVCVQNIVQCYKEHDCGQYEEDRTTVSAVERFRSFIGDPAHYFFHILLVYIDSPKAFEQVEKSRMDINYLSCHDYG